MPFRLAKPVVTEQGEFPLAALSLIVSPAFGESTVEARIVLQAQPYAVRDGVLVRPMTTVQTEDEDGNKTTVDVPDTSFDVCVSFGQGYSDAAANPSLAKALMTMGAALQEFLLVNKEMQHG